MSRLLVNGVATKFINSKEGVARFVDFMHGQDTSKGHSEPRFFVDVEGVNMCRNGSVSLLTILVKSGMNQEELSIIDMHTLQRDASETKGSCGKSLKDILESPDIIKVFFDVRNDSDALYSHYGINLGGIWDVQLMHSASRATTMGRRYLSGLSRCVQSLFFQDYNQLQAWKRHKKMGEQLWKPEKGGSFEVFNIRPLPEQVLSYCAGDVQKLPALYHKYMIPTKRWMDLIATQSQNRVVESQQADYQPTVRFNIEAGGGEDFHGLNERDIVDEDGLPRQGIRDP
ncbi:hypothetical protein E4U55_000488 [Claviceps digitariae]|nr:hypothetical protein E4U55_000488 [Claviceps digitariae]